MSRVPPFSSPLLVGFETIEKSLERIAKSSDGYPPYNIERLVREGAEVLRITLAVAGFSIEDLDISTEDSQLVIRGRQSDGSSSAAAASVVEKASAASAADRRFIGSSPR